MKDDAHFKNYVEIEFLPQRKYRFFITKIKWTVTFGKYSLFTLRVTQNPQKVALANTASKQVA